MLKLAWKMDVYYFVCIYGDMYGIIRLYTYIYIDIFEMNADIKSVKWAVSKIQLSKSPDRMHSDNNCKQRRFYSVQPTLYFFKNLQHDRAEFREFHRLILPHFCYSRSK